MKTSMRVFEKLFPEQRVVGFNHRQGQFLFFSMIAELVKLQDFVLDFGAGRGLQSKKGSVYLRSLSTLKGRCAKLVGVDVDAIVLDNPFLDEAHLLGEDGVIPLADGSVDLVYSYAVFEHVEQADAVARELTRVVKAGGWICAWTPNKWGYVAIGARLVPNHLHSRLLRTVSPGGRAAEDVFPTRYRMNTVRSIKRLFPEFEDFSFGFNGHPSYNFGSSIVARLILLYMALMPRFLSQSLFIFLRKRSDPNQHLGPAVTEAA